MKLISKENDDGITLPQFDSRISVNNYNLCRITITELYIREQVKKLKFDHSFVPCMA